MPSRGKRPRPGRGRGRPASALSKTTALLDHGLSPALEKHGKGLFSQRMGQHVRAGPRVRIGVRAGVRLNSPELGRATHQLARKREDLLAPEFGLQGYSPGHLVRYRKFRT